MSQRDIRFPEKDLPLRQDVSLLGSLVGDMLREQGGDTLFEAVEAARQASIRRREGDATAEASLCLGLSQLSVPQAHDVARAFETYFQTTNLAEKVHRIRRRRHYLRQQAAPQKHSLQDLVQSLQREGLSFADLAALLERLSLEPVFTAHPTQALRRSLLEKRQDIARRLVERLDPSMTPPEEEAAQGRIRSAITAAWQTDPHPTQRPSVGEERDGILFYLTDILYRIVPAFYEAFDDALASTYGAAAEGYEIPQVLRFASWVGGDMDGNPNVGAETIANTLRRQRGMVLSLYRQDVRQLARQLSQSASRVTVSEAVANRLVRYRELFAETYGTIPRRHLDMPYRVLLQLIEARLAATEQDADSGYDKLKTFEDDLRSILDSLVQHKGAQAGSFGVRRLLRRCQCFGFHLATLDVRQDAMVHRRAVAALLGRDDWLGLEASTRTQLLRQALDTPEAELSPPGTNQKTGDADLERTLQVMAAIRDGRRLYGDAAIGPHIISMTQGADDVLSLLLLARQGGLRSSDAESPESGVELDIAPLFETVPDLQAAPEIMTALLAEPHYRRHLASRDDRQIIMVGYSDSNKEGGLTASRWGLQKAQAQLGKALSSAGIDLTIFHGRGGTVGRGGGGRTHQAVMAAPSGTISGRLRFTEQGESIDFKYGLRSIAMRTLERTTSALALATAGGLPEAPDLERWRQIMGDLATASRQAYRGLVYGDDGFFAYFRHATPIDVIERMAIGSRPSSRRQQRGIEDLRAIPWVFAWSQSRHNLPGWLGLGRGLEAIIDRHGEDDLIVMARHWPFLASLLDDVASVLAETDLAIAGRYAELAPQGQRIHQLIRSDYDLTVDLLERLQGFDLLDNNPTLRRAIRLRNPYVDPMSLLQVDLLGRWRHTDRQDDAMLQALLTTVQGIAQGLQGTG